MRSDTYHAPAIALHWASALLIIAGAVLGLVMTDMPGLSPAKLKYFAWHKWIGVTALLLALPRLACRLARPAPPPPAGMGLHQQRAARLTHGALYGLLLAVPISGLLYTQAAGVPVVVFGVLEIPALLAPDPAWKQPLQTVHRLLNDTLIGLVALHVLAALKHQFIDRDNLLARMLPFLKEKNS